MLVTFLNQYDNSWYNPGKSLLMRTMWYYTNGFIFQSTWLPFNGLKLSLLRLFGAKVGKGVIIKPGVNIKYPWLLQIGDHSWIGEKVWVDNLVQVHIGAHCCLSQGAMLLTGSHNYSKSTFDLMVGKIVLETGVWIGANTIVCPGVTCHSHSVLSVGSVATQDLEPYTVYQGNPALPKRERKITT